MAHPKENSRLRRNQSLYALWRHTTYYDHLWKQGGTRHRNRLYTRSMKWLTEEEEEKTVGAVARGEVHVIQSSAEEVLDFDRSY